MVAGDDSGIRTFDDLEGKHAAFENLTKEETVSQALSAPLHPSAEKYDKEAGPVSLSGPGCAGPAPIALPF